MATDVRLLRKTYLLAQDRSLHAAKMLNRAMTANGHHIGRQEVAAARQLFDLAAAERRQAWHAYVAASRPSMASR